MEATLFDYIISQGPAWVVAGVVSFFLWKLFNFYREREDQRNEEIISRLQRDEARFEGIVKNAEARLRCAEERLTAQQDGYIQSWMKMTAESLEVQSQFVQYITEVQRDISGSVDVLTDMHELLVTHDNRLKKWANGG